MPKQVLSARVAEELTGWLDDYAKQRSSNRAEVLEAALRSFREDCESGTPDLEAPPEPPRLKPGECSEVEILNLVHRYARGEKVVYGESVEPPGDAKFVCPRGDCGWSGASKVEQCPEHGRWAVPRGSVSRRIIKDCAPLPERDRKDFIDVTGQRAAAFSRLLVTATAVIGGSESRDESNRRRQDALNKAKGMD